MYKKLIPSIITFLFIAQNIPAQDTDGIVAQNEEASELSIISDSINKEIPEEASVDSTRKILHNSIFAGILSVNYSRIIYGEKTIFTAGGGLSFAPLAFADGSIGLMAEASILKGRTKHFFEPGILLYADSNIIAPMVRAGYRYQDPGGFLFRVGILLAYMDGFSVLPALSIGYSF
jgi:hypothetical protein